MKFGLELMTVYALFYICAYWYFQWIKRFKSIWWMPWHQEAKKDVALCDKLRGDESNL